MGISAVDVHSQALRRVLGWHRPPPASATAAQLSALGKAIGRREDTDVLAAKQHVQSAVMGMYENLDRARRRSARTGIDVGLEWNNAMAALRGEAWVWVEEGFVTASVVAFEAPDNGRPHLYPVPDALRLLHKTLSALGVRKRFEPLDYVSALRGLQEASGGESVKAGDLELALGMARFTVCVIERSHCRANGQLADRIDSPRFRRKKGT